MEECILAMLSNSIPLESFSLDTEPEVLFSNISWENLTNMNYNDSLC